MLRRPAIAEATAWMKKHDMLVVMIVGTTTNWWWWGWWAGSMVNSLDTVAATGVTVYRGTTAGLRALGRWVNNLFD